MGKYFYSGKRLALELDGAQARSILYAGEYVLSERDRNELSASTLLLAVSKENSVLKGNRARSYNAYGFDDLTSRQSLIGFNGEARDDVVGCDLLGNGTRAYSPVLMRFLSPDNMSPFAEGGINAYAYCEGDPTNFKDPSGRGKTRAASNQTPVKPQPGAMTIEQRVERNARRRLDKKSNATIVSGFNDLTQQQKFDALVAQGLHIERTDIKLNSDGILTVVHPEPLSQPMTFQQLAFSEAMITHERQTEVVHSREASATSMSIDPREIRGLLEQPKDK